MTILWPALIVAVLAICWLAGYGLRSLGDYRHERRGGYIDLTGRRL